MPKKPSEDRPPVTDYSAMAHQGHSADTNAIVHTIHDITVRDDLIRYAVEAQICHVRATHRQIAMAANLSDMELHAFLSGRKPIPVSVLRNLDDVFVALGHRSARTGGLAQFGVRMRELSDRAAVSAKIPPSWTRDILDTHANDELHVLVQATTLLTNFVVAQQAGAPTEAIEYSYQREIKRVVSQLILIAGGPPTPRHTEAQILLGNLAKYTFRVVTAQIEWALRGSPLGFRVWRSVTKLVMTARDDLSKKDDRLYRNLRPWLQKLIGETQRLRADSIYPGRSLDLELLISIPVGWLDGATDPVNAALADRAFDDDATLRERGMAAMGLWQRAVDSGRFRDETTRGELTSLIRKFREQSSRPDIAAGLNWVATTLEIAMNNDVAVCNTWPRNEEPWYALVMELAEGIEGGNLPRAVATATKNLFLQILLQNAGVERRCAIETLTAGGLSEEVGVALGRLLFEERSVTWLRIRALFALGYMQLRNTDVEQALIQGCRRAQDAIAASDDPSHAQITELQTALFAIGDVCGVQGAEDFARSVRGKLSPLFIDLVDKGQTLHPNRHRIARALAYLLTFTAQPRRHPGAPDLSETLLRQLRNHPDRVTQHLSEWALGFRFGPDGEIRSMLEDDPNW